MKRLEQRVAVTARFDNTGGIRPVEFFWQGRCWPVCNVIRTWQRYALPGQHARVFVVETQARLAQLSFFPLSGWWRLDKM